MEFICRKGRSPGSLSGMDTIMNPIFSSHFPVARQEQLLFQDVGEELVIYDRQRSTAHHLNVTATIVWRHCDGEHSIAQLGEVIAQRSQALPDAGQDLDAAVQDVAVLALEQLQKARLLTTELPVFPDSSPGEPETTQKSSGTSQKRLSRRHLLRGAASGLLVLPLVASMVAPTPASAASVPPVSPILDPSFYQGGRSNDEWLLVAPAAAAMQLASGQILKEDCERLMAMVIGGCGGLACVGAGLPIGLQCLPALDDAKRCVCRPPR